MRYAMYRVKHRLKAVYVTILLVLLPLMLRILRSKRVIARESENLPHPFSFRLCVGDSPVSKTIVLTQDSRHKAHFTRTKNLPDFTIEFVSTEDAFKVFSGGKSLRQAVAEHTLSTQGNLNQGVSLTYLFDGVLRTFFFWRSSYARI